MNKKNHVLSKEYIADHAVVVFLLLCFFTYFVWMIMVPLIVPVKGGIYAAPDEYMRMDLIEYMLANGRLPVGDDPSIRNSLWGFSYAFLPFFPQIISAVFCKVFFLLRFPVSLLPILARFPSVLFSTASAWFCLKIGEKTFHNSFKWVFAVSVAFLPQFIFLSAYVNNESLAFLGAVATVYMWLRGSENGWRIKDCVLLALSLCLCILSYYNVYGFILFTIPFFVITFFIGNKEEMKKGETKAVILDFCKKSFLIIGICLLLTGWFFIRNYLLYHDFFGLQAMKNTCELYAIDTLKPSNRVHPESIKVMLFDMDWIKITVKSFIGYFGAMAIPMSRKIYSLYIGTAIVGTVCNLFYIGNKNRKKVQWLFFFALVLSALVAIALSIYSSYTSDFQPQGRYIIYAILPISFIVAKGFESLCGRIQKSRNLSYLFSFCYCSVYIYMAYFIFFKYIVTTSLNL